MMKKLMPRQPLMREIVIALAIKLALIIGLYFAFFAGSGVHPHADDVAAHFAQTKHNPR